MVRCPVCSENNKINLIKKEKDYSYSPSNKCLIFLNLHINPQFGYSLYWCNNCDLIFTEPMKNPGREFYEDDFLPYRIGRILDNQQLRWPQKTFLQDRILPYGNLLDVGCNTGLFISIAQNYGFRVTGIDFDQKAIKIAKTNFKLKNVYPVILEEFIPLVKEKFDIISFFDVLEHLSRPRETFQQIKNILKIGGYIVLSIPNRERGVNTFTEMDLPPHHLTQWNENAIRYLLHNCGFEIVKLVKTVQAEDIALYISIKSSIGLVRKKVESSDIYPISGGTINLLRLLSRCKTKLVYALGNILYWPFAAMGKQSSTIYVLAKLENNDLFI